MINCDFCGIEQSGDFGSGRFCNDTCAKKYASNSRKKKNAKMRSKIEIERMREKLNKIKLTKGCTQCKYAKTSAALEFVFISGIDGIPITRMILYAKYSIDEITNKLGKYQILCLNCKRENEISQRQAGVKRVRNQNTEVKRLKEELKKKDDIIKNMNSLSDKLLANKR